MIQTKLKVKFGNARIGTDDAIIKMIITSWTVKKDGILFQIDALRLQDDGSTILDEKITKFKDNQQLNDIDKQLEIKYNYSGLKKVDKDWLKAQHLLLHVVQNDLYSNGLTDYQIIPEHWELSNS